MLYICLGTALKAYLGKGCSFMTQWQYKFWQKEYKKTLSVMFALLALVLLQGGVRVEAANQHHTLDEFGYLETVYDNSNGLDSSAANDLVQT